MFERMQDLELDRVVLWRDAASGLEATASVRTAARRAERAPSFPRGQS